MLDERRRRWDTERSVTPKLQAWRAVTGSGRIAAAVGVA